MASGHHRPGAGEGCDVLVLAGLERLERRDRPLERSPEREAPEPLGDRHVRGGVDYHVAHPVPRREAARDLALFHLVLEHFETGVNDHLNPLEALFRRLACGVLLDVLSLYQVMHVTCKTFSLA